MRIINAACALVFRSYDENGLELLMVEQQAKAIQLRHNHGAKTFWSPPCGKLDGNEDFAEAAIRECYEETGVIVTQPYELYRAQSYLPIEGIDLTMSFMWCTLLDDNNLSHANDPDQQILQAKWLPFEQGMDCVATLLDQYFGHKVRQNLNRLTVTI